MVKCSFEACGLYDINHEFNIKTCPLGVIFDFFSRWESKQQQLKLYDNIFLVFEDIENDKQLISFRRIFSKAKLLMTAFDPITSAEIIIQFLDAKDPKMFQNFDVFVQGVSFALSVSSIDGPKGSMKDVNQRVADITEELFELRVQLSEIKNKKEETHKMEEDLSQGISQLMTVAELEYPHQFFEINNRKPEVIINFGNKNLAELREAAYSSLCSGKKPELEVITAYFYEALKNKTCNNYSLWESYGQIIATANTRISIFAPLQVQRECTGELKYNFTNLDDSVDKWMPAVIHYLYGITVNKLYSKDNTIIINLAKKYTEAATFHTGQGFNTLLPLIKNWVNDRNFTSLIAAHDMFSKRFRTQFPLLLGYGLSEYRDCEAWFAYEHLRFILQLNWKRCNLQKESKCANEEWFRNIEPWLYTDNLIKEYNQISNEKEEMFKVDSYFGYQKDLGLVNNSVYSAAANPHFYYWCHIISALNGSTISPYKKFYFVDDMLATERNAMALAYVTAKVQEKVEICKHTSLYSAFGNYKSGTILSGFKISKVSNGLLFEFPENMLKWLKDESKQFKLCEEDTIGYNIYHSCQQLTVG